jgi:hypothetical protein
MPKWTQDEFDSYQRLTGSRHPKSGSRTSVQEQENNLRETPHHRPKGTAMDGAGYAGFVLTVEILVSDKRRRDLDGALATICDVIVAVGRQLESDTAHYRESQGSGEG